MDADRIARLRELEASMRFYIDCEFDGHNGPLLSIGIVSGRGEHNIHIEANIAAVDPWVVANVVPLLDKHDAIDCIRVEPNDVGGVLRAFFSDVAHPIIIADSPVDIGRFCRAISTGPDGGWASVDFARISFEVHNVDCYPTDLPGAVQHNAWWDAMALRHRLAALRTDAKALLDAAERVGVLEAKNARLREAVDRAAGWFEGYAAEHYAKAKTAPDGGEQHSREVKGKANADRAKKLRATLTGDSHEQG